jgi:cell division protein FtsB
MTPVTPHRSLAAGPPRTAPRGTSRLLQYVVLFVGGAVAADALVGEKGLLATIRTRQEYRVLQESLAGARTENARLREQARQLREVPEVIEGYARRELGLIRRGEMLFIIRELPAPNPR